MPGNEAPTEHDLHSQHLFRPASQDLDGVDSGTIQALNLPSKGPSLLRR